ncbi:MAG: single-stranded-DNA-specific exonuclease RecJ [Betaproteobacteria bacterium]|nr:single-stranded-DNA-specific exonuclease RecJ [Betaproteobacteria bacterium]
MPSIALRPYSTAIRDALVRSGVPPLLARVYAARGIRTARQIETGFAGLAPVERLKNVQHMARILADAIASRKRLTIVADYDADGATACAVGVCALRAFGALVDYLVPNRFEYGYGLTPEIVRLAHAAKRPDFLITVDNGIASIEGVAEAARLGIEVLITDHHLPGAALPDALCIVDPSQSGCEFPSKSLAGVGVMFYAMLALRAELRARGAFASRREPNLADLLDLVALGTVADVVRLDDNNRILVAQGLRRIRAGRCRPGIAALLRATVRDPRRASTYDLGFVLGPRLNAAGRLEDMALGIECLTTDDPTRALEIAHRLDALNRERRDIEAGMHETALAAIDSLQDQEGYTLCLFDPSWHQGVVGILASRLKERFHRPVIAFARGTDNEIKGSGRSIASLHLRDALDLVAKRNPGMLLRFGGHAAAAGLTLREADFDRFAAAFEHVAQSLLCAADLERVIETDGGLAAEEMTLEAATLLGNQIWGHGFPPPLFDDAFEVAAQRVVGEKHLKLKLRPAASPAGGAAGTEAIEAMRFGCVDPLPSRVHAVYRMGVNEFNGTLGLQLIVEHWEPW